MTLRTLGSGAIWECVGSQKFVETLSTEIDAPGIEVALPD